MLNMKIMFGLCHFVISATFLEPCRFFLFMLINALFYFPYLPFPFQNMDIGISNNTNMFLLLIFNNVLFGSMIQVRAQVGLQPYLLSFASSFFVFLHLFSLSSFSFEEVIFTSSISPPPYPLPFYDQCARTKK